VQHGGEDGALDLAGKIALGQQRRDHTLAAGLAPQAAEHQAGADAPRAHRRQLAGPGAGDHRRVLGKLAAGGHQLVELAAGLGGIQPSQGRQHALATAPAVADVLDRLQVGVALVDLLAENIAAPSSHRHRWATNKPIRKRYLVTLWHHTTGGSADLPTPKTAANRDRNAR